MAKARRKGEGGEKPQRKAFLLRLPPELLERLRTLAARDLRSLNGEIEYLLRRAVGQAESDDED